jgi:hypothetical protein
LLSFEMGGFLMAIRSVSRGCLGVRAGIAVLLVVAAAGVSRAADGVTFPEDPKQWVNAQPVTAEMLQGKGVVLYFFEEG